MKSEMENERDVYQMNGYASREDYIECLADDFGVSVFEAWAIADMLGPNEDFDGLVTSLEDYSMGC
jgi:hypothetical protein